MNGPRIFRALAYAGILMATGGGGFLLGRSLTQRAPAPTQAAPAIAETSELKLDPSFLRTVGIATGQAASGDLRVDVLAPGTVTAAPNGEAVVTAHASGTVIRLEKQLGDSVREGEILALVESREAAAMAADRNVAQTKSVLAQQALSREQELYRERVTPRQDLERAQADLAVAEAELQRARETAAAAHLTDDGRIAIASPLSGRITAIAAALGKFVQPDTELFRVADPHFVQVEALVAAADLNRVSVGDSAKVTLPSGSELGATIRSVAPTLDAQTRTATVVLSLAAGHGPLSPGEIVQVDIAPRNAVPSGVIVPEEAVQNVEGRNVVFVRSAAGFQVRPVVIGSRSGGRASIVSGLKAGETIATTNAFFLKAELGKGTGGDE